MKEKTAEAWAEGFLKMPLWAAEQIINGLSDEDREMVVSEMFRQYHLLCA